jgi:hypothetical protein
MRGHAAAATSCKANDDGSGWSASQTDHENRKMWD